MVLRDLILRNYVFQPGIDQSPHVMAHMTGRRDVVLDIFTCMYDQVPTAPEIDSLRG